MGFFSSSPSNKDIAHYRLIVSLEPNSVGIGMTHVGSTTLEFFDRQYISYGSSPSMRQMQSKLSVLLRQMMGSFMKKHIDQATIDMITCIHSSAWSLAETHTIDLHFEKPQKIQKKIILDSVQHHRKAGVSKAQSKSLELVYHHVQKVRLNGYFTDAPWDKVAQHVSCDLIEGYIDATMKKFCESELLRYSSTLVHVPEAFVVMNAMQELIPDSNEILIVHIGGETTELIYAGKNHIKQTASTPSGISSIVRDTAKIVHGDESLAFSHIIMSTKGQRALTKREQSAYNAAVTSWSNDLIKGIQVVCGNNVPETIFFFSAVHSMPIAQRILDAKDLKAWSGKAHRIINLFGKKIFQHDLLIAAGAQYVVE